MARTLVGQTKDSRENYFINGDMAIAIRGTSFAAIANQANSLDRHQYIKSGSAVHTLTQDTDVPSVAQANYLFSNSLRLNLTTADTSIAAGDYVGVGQIIEGFNWRNLAQKGFTIGFWVKATLAGTYCIGMQNSAADRGYAAEYTINSSAVWEYKTVTIPASPAAGTWNYTNGVGLKIWWMLACGSTFQFATGAWQTGTVLATANQINGVNTGATDFRLTGLTINEGSSAVPFKLFGLTRDGEINACQRYAAWANGGLTGEADTTTLAGMGVKLAVPMRAIPSISRVGTATIRNHANDFSSAAGTISNFSAVVDSNTGQCSGIWFNLSGFTALTQFGVLYDRGTSSWLFSEAELS